MTAAEVAEWMLQEVLRQGVVYQETMVGDIEMKFGATFVYSNERGNPAISKEVLAAFKKASASTVVWVQGERAWRKREANDEPGRRQY